MSLESIHADGIEEGLQRWARNPGPDPGVDFHTTSFLASGLKGLPSAALEVGGSVADLLSGFATPLAASGGSAGGMFSIPTEAEQKQEAQAREQMLHGSSFDTSGGNMARRKADSFAPDPLTAHTADQVLHGLLRFGGKAIAAVGTMGPAAGAVVLGVEEANTATQRLRMEGVDTATAVQAGAVQGGMAAAGAVMPLAGKTILQTLGLVAAGGPGSYVAQEALTRKILQQAGYDDQASLHNPFDPLGLVLSTVIPGVIGAVHVRGQQTALARVVEHIESGGQRYGKDGQLLTSPKGAQGEMQVMPGTAKDPGFGVTPAKDGSPEELTRVGRDYLAAMQQRYTDDPAKALAAYNAGPGAVDKAVAAHGDDWLKNLPRETQEYVHKARALLTKAVAEDAARDPATVDAARVATTNEALVRSLPDTPDALAQVMRAADIVGESGGRAAEAVIPEPRVTAMEQELRQVEDQLRAHGVEPPPEPPPKSTEPRSQFDESGEPIGYSYADMSREERTAFDRRHGIPPGRREEVDAANARMELQNLQSRIHAASFGDKHFAPLARDSETAADVMRTADADVARAQLQVRAAELRAELAKERANQQPRPAPREPDHSLPDPHSVKLEGDEPTARGEELGKNQRAAGEAKEPATSAAKPKDAETVARDLALMQKRHSTLQTLLDCLEG